MYPATPRHPRHLVLWQALLPALPVYGVQDIVRESYKGRTKLIGDVHQRNCTLLISNIGTDHSGGTTSVPTWAVPTSTPTQISLSSRCWVSLLRDPERLFLWAGLPSPGIISVCAVLPTTVATVWTWDNNDSRSWQAQIDMGPA